MRIVLYLSYDGTDYAGWQSQKNADSIQKRVEKALNELTHQNIKITASGRTDAGVHAKEQVCHFDIDNCKIPPEKFRECLNTLLPYDIKVIKSKKTQDDFHARYFAKQKTYIYNMYISDVILPLKDRYSLRINPVNIDSMKNAAHEIVGEHDFKAFSSTGSSVKTSLRTIYSLDIEKKGNDITLSITGNGFLYNMVRIIAGTLLEIGYDKKSISDIKKAFDTKDRNYTGKTLPARALLLDRVKYVNV